MGFPRHFGLNENNVIFRAHTAKMQAADAEWWDWIVNYSSRDQFSYMYCLWKHKVELNYFLPEGEDTRTSDHFRLVDHDGRTVVIKTKVIKRSLIEKLRIKSKSFDPERHKKRWLAFCESPHPVTSLYLDGVITIFANFPRLLKLMIR